MWSRKDLKSKSIFALKQMMMAFGISTTNVIEKDDMITSICESGRIQLLFDETDDVSSIPTSITGVNTTLYSYSSSALLGGDDFDYLPSSKASTPSPTKTSSHTSFGSTPTPPPARSPATNTTSSSYSYTSTTSTSSSSSSSRQQSNSHSRSHTRGESRSNSECTTH